MFEISKLALLNAIATLKNDRKGAGALEYALLVAFIAMAVVTGATTFGSDLSTWFSNMGAAVVALKT